MPTKPDSQKDEQSLCKDCADARQEFDDDRLEHLEVALSFFWLKFSLPERNHP